MDPLVEEQAEKMVFESQFFLPEILLRLSRVVVLRAVPIKNGVRDAAARHHWRLLFLAIFTDENAVLGVLISQQLIN